MIARLIEYYDVEIESYYATILLSGIVLDTNNYTLNTTAETYYSSYYLSSLGASAKKVQYLLKQDIEDLTARLSTYKDSFISKLFFKFNKEYKTFKQFFINKHKPGFNELLYDLSNIKEFKKLTNKLDKSDNAAKKLYSEFWNIQNLNENDINKQSERLLKFKELIKAQGGNPDVIDNYDLMALPAYKVECRSKKSGYVHNIDAYKAVAQAIEEKWTHHNVLYGFMPDHGCHQIDKSAGSHGLDMEEDMNIIHFYGAKPRM